MRRMIARLNANACVMNQTRSRKNWGYSVVSLCIVPIACAVLFSQPNATDTRQMPNSGSASTLQIDIFCGEMKTATDFHFTIDEQVAGKIDVKFKGRLPCLGSFHARLEPGVHTLRVESKRLKTSGSLSIAIRPGQNWVVVNPRSEAQGSRSQWRLFMEQEKNQPMYQ